MGSAETPVSRTQVDLLLTAAIQWGGADGFLYYVDDGQSGGSTHHVNEATADRTGAMLLRTVRVRASSAAASPDGYRFEPLVGEAHPPLVLGCIAGLEQVCVDRDDWLGSEAEAFIAYLRSAAASRADLPEVPWGLTDGDRDIFLRAARSRSPDGDRAEPEGGR